MIFADDQYENFREDVLPPFCIYAMDEFSLAQSNGKRRGGGDGLGPRRLTREPHIDEHGSQETLWLLSFGYYGLRIEAYAFIPA